LSFIPAEAAMAPACSGLASQRTWIPARMLSELPHRTSRAASRAGTAPLFVFVAPFAFTKASIWPR